MAVAQSLRPHLPPLKARPSPDAMSGSLPNGRANSNDIRFDAADGQETAKSTELPEQGDLRSLAEKLGVPYCDDLRKLAAAGEFIERVPIGFARRFATLAFAGVGIADGDGTLLVAIGAEANWHVLDVVARHLKRTVSPIFAPEQEILDAINRAYQRRDSQSASMVEVLDPRDTVADLQNIIGREDLLDSQGSSPIIRLVNSILFEAVKARASDIHVQPMETSMVIRQRIDGVLFDTLTVPKSCQEEVISRLKVLGRMNIAEKRLPQDGRTTVQFGDRMVDLRIASLPTSFGERVVVRFLDKSAVVYA